jgi:hypothetical protein
MHVGYWWGDQNERDPYEDLDVGGRIKLKWFLVKWYGVIWGGFFCLRTGTSDGLM